MSSKRVRQLIPSPTLQQHAIRAPPLQLLRQGQGFRARQPQPYALPEHRHAHKLGCGLLHLLFGPAETDTATR